MSDDKCSRENRPTCELDHCRTCNTWHEAPTCIRCYGATARAIRDIVEQAALLPSHAIHGQSGDPHGELHIPGGDALVMIVGGSNHVTGDRARHRHEPDVPCRCGHLDPTIKHVPRRHAVTDVGPAAYSYPSDPNPAEEMLGSWEDDWRHRLGMPASTNTDLVDVAAFLLRHLGWAASQHPAFPLFSREVGKAARALEQILHTGIRDEIGVRCIRCVEPPRLRARFVDIGHQPTSLDVEHHKTPLVDDQGGRRDWWECPKCHEIYSPKAYLQATGDDLAHEETG